MGIGTSMRAAVTATINSIGSTVTITPYTITAAQIGYGGVVPTDSTAVSETAIPFEEMKSVTKQNFGDLETGQFMLALKYTATFDTSGSTKYRFTYNSDTYDLVKVDRYAIEDVLVAFIATLTKRFD